MWLWRPSVRIRLSTPYKRKRLFAFFSYLPEYGSPILARIHLDIGLSPSGKATDFDSVIPLVRIQPAQPRRSKLCIACSDFFVKIRAHTRRTPLLFRKRSHSARLLGCKRPHNGSLSLPSFCGCACGAKIPYTQVEFLAFLFL